MPIVSEACQINDLDHGVQGVADRLDVSEACQINDLDHCRRFCRRPRPVSEACQINDLDHIVHYRLNWPKSFRSLSDQ